MFPRRYFAARMFAPLYFPESRGDAPVVPTTTTYNWRERPRRRLYR